jgi:hypothetical protein
MVVSCEGHVAAAKGDIECYSRRQVMRFAATGLLLGTAGCLTPSLAAEAAARQGAAGGRLGGRGGQNRRGRDQPRNHGEQHRRRRRQRRQSQRGPVEKDWEISLEVDNSAGLPINAAYWQESINFSGYVLDRTTLIAPGGVDRCELNSPIAIAVIADGAFLVAFYCQQGRLQRVNILHDGEVIPPDSYGGREFPTDSALDVGQHATVTHGEFQLDVVLLSHVDFASAFRISISPTS